MLKILLVEDNDEKLEIVRGAIESYFQNEPYEIEIASTFILAKRSLALSNFDIAIIDIQIPMRAGEIPDKLGGVKLVREIDGNSIVKRPRYILGLTEYEESISDAASDFTGRVFGLIHYSRNSTIWRDQLNYTLAHVSRSIHSIRSMSELSAGVPTSLVIVCALSSPELKAVLDLPLAWTDATDDRDCITMHKAVLTSKSGQHNIVAAATLEAGMAATAALCGRLIHVFKPRYIAMTGIAGGMKAETNFGDIVFADFVWDYTNGKLKNQRGTMTFMPEPKVIDADALVKSQFLRTVTNTNVLKQIQGKWTGKSPGTALNAVFGPMFCGTSVIADRNVTASLEQMNRKIKGIDMESYAVFTAAKYAEKPEPIPIALKSVSDHADAKKSNDWHSYASYTSASLLFEWAKRFL